MKSDALENQLRGYLLGELPEAEQTALERELLADREKFDAAWAVENGLIDRYVRGELPAADRDRFERHYLASDLHRERVAIAELFLDEIEAPVEARAPAFAASRWRRLWDSLRGPQLAFAGAMAMALLLAAGGAFWLLRERSRLRDQLARVQDRTQAELRSAEQRQRDLELQNQGLANEVANQRTRNQQLHTELDRLRQDQAPAPSAFLSFLLTPVTRDQNGPPPPLIPRVKRGVQLLMGLGGDDHSSYQIKLQTVEGREVLSRPASKTKDRAFAAVTLPAGTLASGDYILILSGQTARGELEEVDRYFFRVR